MADLPNGQQTSLVVILAIMAIAAVVIVLVVLAAIGVFTSSRDSHPLLQDTSAVP